MGADKRYFLPYGILNFTRFLLKLIPLQNGKGKIIDKTFLRNVKFREKTLHVPTLYGARMEVLPNDHVGRHVFFLGTFDRPVFECLRLFAGNTPVLWDIGANIGYMSIEFLNLLPNAHVLAIEPLPDIFAILEQNLRRISANRALCLNCAVSDRSGIARMQRVSDNSGGSFISIDGDEITTVSGDTLLDMAPAPTVIKIDVEGHEAQVLQGLQSVLSNPALRAVVFEHHTQTTMAEDVRKPLHDAGFKIFRIWKNAFTWALCDAERQNGRAGYYPTADFAAVRNPAVPGIKVLR